MRRFGLLASITLVLACGDDGAPADDETENSTGFDTFPMMCMPGVPVECTCADGAQGQADCIGGTQIGECECGGETESTTTMGTNPTETGETDSDDTDTTGVAGECGNGVVEGDEDCDDGNDIDDDECNNNCVASGCVLERINATNTIDGVGRAAAFDSDGNYIVATAGADTLLYVEKYLPDGTLSWTNSYDLDPDGDLEAVPLTIATFGNDSIFISGRQGPEGTTSSIFVHRVLGDGMPVANWPSFSGNADGGSLATDTNGNVILVGWLYSPGGENLAVRKFAPDASVTWTYISDAGGGEDDRGTAVATDSANNIWVGVDILGANRTANLMQLPPNDTGETPVPTLAVTGPLVTGDGIPANRTLRGIANNSSDNAIVAIATDPSAAPNTWDFWVTEVDSTGTTQFLSSATDLGITGSARSVTGVGLYDSDRISLLGSVDDGGLAILSSRVSADGTMLLCSQAATDALLGTTFTVGTFGTHPMDGSVIAGATSDNPAHPWVAVFRP